MPRLSSARSSLGAVQRGRDPVARRFAITPGRATALVLAALCAGCAGGGRYGATGWDGRRGYDGNGDYGYDLAASREEAGGYARRAARNYPVPGTADDPWGPYIREAAARFAIPERWVREVMRQESGGHQDDADGLPITSSAGAMGLMQVMPGTYELLRQRYGLGGDPYEPHDNILAGAAYIREMYDMFGAPGFLAAYNAGPDRLSASLSGGEPLPDETVNYLASVAPRLGDAVAMSGPLAAYAGGGAAVAAEDASYRAFDGGGLVTPDAPTGVLTAVSIPARPPEPSAPAVVPVATGATYSAGGWAIQVGAYPDPANSAAAIAAARARAAEFLDGARPAIIPIQRAGTLYRARLLGLSAQAAVAACARLSGQGVDCFAVPPGS
jgi:hypothetical protein